jgi:hypothetical protein
MGRIQLLEKPWAKSKLLEKLWAKSKLLEKPWSESQTIKKALVQIPTKIYAKTVDETIRTDTNLALELLGSKGQNQWVC